MLFHHLLTFFKIYFFKKFFLRNIVRVLNSLDPEQDRQNVGPVLGPSCLHLDYQQTTNVGTSKERVKRNIVTNVLFRAMV